MSSYAQRRERRLRDTLARDRIGLEVFPGVTVLPPGDLAPAEGDHYRVFTPYWRRWRQEPRRDLLPAPERLSLPDGLAVGALPLPGDLVKGAPAPELPPGGETAGRRRLEAWLDDGLQRYAELADDLAADATSRLSPYLHFGCVSPGEVVGRALEREGAEPFVRQLCWRDFNHQLLAARPETAWEDLRPRAVGWRDDEECLEAWRVGRTGYPLVDAGMRQLLREGFMHNRARLVTGSFLTKHLGIDWRRGAEHFFAHLVDGDVANNTGNWQWVAGTGTDSRPNRMLSPVRQAQRFDPNGVYARRYVAGARHARLPGADRCARGCGRPLPTGGRVTGWETTERVLESGGFESRQRVLVPEPVVEASEAGARTLGVTYWVAVDRFTRGGVRASWSGGGGKLKLLGASDAPHVRPAAALGRARSRLLPARDPRRPAGAARRRIGHARPAHGGASSTS